MKVILEARERNNLDHLVVEGSVELSLYATQSLGKVPYLHILTPTGENVYLKVSEVIRAINALDGSSS